jgi:hypothetical protein
VRASEEQMAQKQKPWPLYTEFRYLKIAVEWDDIDSDAQVFGPSHGTD